MARSRLTPSIKDAVALLSAASEEAIVLVLAAVLLLVVKTTTVTIPARAMIAAPPATKPMTVLLQKPGELLAAVVSGPVDELSNVLGWPL
jgi:hypothetical protein